MEAYKSAHAEALRRFRVDPSKCYQRHIREVWSVIDDKHSPCTEACKKSCAHLPKEKREVKRITTEEAAAVILKYEWLAANSNNKSPLGRGVEACYGLFLDGELIGANCLGRMGGKVGDICGPHYADKTGYLMRGACAHYAPMHAASFFTSTTCKLARKDMGWSVFFAYSDTEDASECGTIYQACGWYYIGSDLGRGNGSHHSDYLSPDGNRIITSYQLNHDGKDRNVLRSLGWTPDIDMPMRKWLRDVAGWKEIRRYGKKKWVTFVGTDKDKKEMMAVCRYPVGQSKDMPRLPYPKDRVPDRKK